MRLFSLLVHLFFKRKKKMTVEKVTLSIFSELDFSDKPLSLSNTVNKYNTVSNTGEELLW